MLRIGLTGGIGAGKSTVSSTFNDRGAVVVDGDVISREVVEPGTEGLAALVEAFGSEILLPDGALNRPALAAVAFSDDEKRATLNGIVHPLVGARRAELIAAAPADAVIVEDIPLLVESQMASMFPLVVIVNADEEVRVARLIEHRGFSEADARARIAAQATEEQRRTVADVWLDNAGSADDLRRRAVELWEDRILPFAHNVEVGQTVSPTPRLVPYDSTWPAQAQRIVKRIHTACGSKTSRVDHIGSTAVPGMEAKDVIDVQVTVASLDVADEIADALVGVGYPRIEGITADVPHTDDESLWRKRIHGAADPGRPANVHVRVDGWPNQEFALLFRDWMIANPDEQAEYVAVKRDPLPASEYGEAKEPWLADAYGRAREWAAATGWQA
jgi:dephospho-CoA kinase